MGNTLFIASMGKKYLVHFEKMISYVVIQSGIPSRMDRFRRL